MSASLTQALRTAQSGLLVNQQALDAVANNISNVNTPSYSRKVVNMEQRVLAGTGSGVQISEVVRKTDEGLLKSLRLELSDLNRLSIQEDYYARMQETFGAPEDNSSIAHIMEEFVSSMETLQVTPDKILEQSDAVRRAQDVTDKFSSMSDTIQELRLQADKEIAEKVSHLNELLEEVANLNDDIIRNGSVNHDVTDLKDQRDQALDKIAQIVDIRYYQRDDGDVIVFTEGGRTLVDNAAETVTHNATSTMTAQVTHATGSIGGIYVGSTTLSTNDITGDLRGGALKGLVELRDEILPNLQSQLDELAAEVRDAVNQIHNRGVSFPGARSMSGTRDFMDASTSTMTLDTTSDVRFTLFNSSGDQNAATTLKTIMINAGLGSGAQNINGPWTVSEVAATLEDWLQANGAGSATVNLDDGHLQIDLNTSSLYFGIRDEVATTQSYSVQFNDANPDTIVGSAGDFSNLVAGSRITISGATNAGNNATFTVASVSADGSTLTLAATDAVTATGGSETVNIAVVPTSGGANRQDATIHFNADGNTASGTHNTISITGGNFTAATDIITLPAGTDFSRFSVGASFTVTNANDASSNQTYTIAAIDASTGEITVNEDITADEVGDNFTINLGADSTHTGFSSFFGLGDFFVDGVGENTHASAIQELTFSTSATTLYFADQNGALTGSPLTIASGTSLSALATQITANVTGVTASVVPDGAGYRLRISHDGGSDFMISEAAGGTLLGDLEMAAADIGTAASMEVNEEFLSTPSKMSRGVVQWDSSRGAAGEYYVSSGDATMIQTLVETLTSTNAFDSAGGLGAYQTTFVDYAASIVSYNADLAQDNERSLEIQQALTDSLQNKSDTFRGVNLDEEMAQLIIFEQAYSAAARVISVIQDMFDALDRAVG